MREHRRRPIERDDMLSFVEQGLADRPADARAAAGDEGAVDHAASTSARTRSGLPLPFSILSGGQISTAPVGGS